MSAWLISGLAFVGVAALVAGVTAIFREKSESRVEDRLTLLTSGKAGPAKEGKAIGASVIARPLDLAPTFLETLFERFGNLKYLFEQADTSLTATKFFALSGSLGLAGLVVPLLAGGHPALAPVSGISFAFLPLLWVTFRRRRRMKKFQAQLPDALDLISRALRSGHSLGAGFNLVQTEMTPPVATEFGRVFEEQNLGIPLEQALQNITQRVPNLDLKFFATAVTLQRQTGGDLAEILDKIGTLIRERFRIWGQVQALTGEGRLSGIVLLALPPVLFLAVYRLNPDYVMTLFTDTMGKQMLAGAVVLQLLGAVVIRKIVNIKV